MNDEQSNVTASSHDWRIIEATFERSVTQLGELIDDALPEVAFVGRSNVGKSSLLNALCARRALARVSKTPGRTQAINSFAVRFRPQAASNNDEDRVIRFTDLPGYGYAKVSASMRKSWEGLLAEYVQQRAALSVIVMLHDSRRTLSAEELWFFESCQAPIVLVLSKADKLRRSERDAAIRDATAAVPIAKDNIIPTSVLRSNDPGLQKVVNRIVGYTELYSAVE